MKNYLGRMVLLVDNYETAADFYAQNFGFKTLFDTTTDVGQRFLHMGTDPTDSFGIWFLKADTKEQKSRVGNQTAGQPTMVIYTTVLEQTFKQLSKNGVNVHIPPVTTPGYSFFHCKDPFGNEIVVVEIKE